MNRRVWTGILAGILAATVILGVAGAAYRVGQHHDAVATRAVGDGGEVVRVVGGYDGWGDDHGGGKPGSGDGPFVEDVGGHGRSLAESSPQLRFGP